MNLEAEDVIRFKRMGKKDIDSICLQIWGKCNTITKQLEYAIEYECTRIGTKCCNSLKYIPINWGSK